MNEPEKWHLTAVELDFASRIGPKKELYRTIAKIIFDNLEEINQLAGQQGQLYQDGDAVRYEWCRLVGMLIEDSLIALNEHE